MNALRTGFEELMDGLATEVKALQTRVLQLDAELAESGLPDLLSRGIVAAYQLDRASGELARPLQGGDSGGGTGHHNPPPIEGGGLMPC